jgi:hypothetical protein
LRGGFSSAMYVPSGRTSTGPRTSPRRATGCAPQWRGRRGPGTRTRTGSSGPQAPASPARSSAAVPRPAPAPLCRTGEHIYRSRGGKKGHVEYENVFALGPMCGVGDPDAVLAASARCDELGIDTISARRWEPCWLTDQNRHPGRSGLTPHRSPRTSRAWRCRGMSRLPRAAGCLS